ncbi:exosortase-associated EpsI family protein [Roseibacillus persicicus]|uniref:exosortase-associated EpsI family protein n=1 Tax=Roseibacillus persicicus TaxID=454148 RepID=UPI00280CEA27|nr:exosortase-associated EpsI family protein [Roseibacillus persicicus]MDQ8188867.1 exosortase-associated EpsI family protein [Roseibacillus persicicus]
MNLYKRTGIFAALAVLTLVCCKFFSEAETNPEAGIVVWLPENRLGFQVSTEQMGKEEKEWLPLDTTFLKRTYYEGWLSRQRATERAVSATLIVAGADSRSLHRPQVCLRAQGWTIEKREVVSLETDGGPLEVMDFSLAQVIRREDGSAYLDANGDSVYRRANYVYWWVGPDSSTASDEERVWLEVWNSILKGRRERWAYPSVMVHVGADGRPAAQKRAYDFIQEFAPHFQKSLGAVEREGAVPLKAIGK